MKKPRELNTVTVVRKKHHGKKIITKWMWPYVVIPACVAGLLALFFFVMGPQVLHWMGINNSLGFWLTVLALWIVATVLCTLLWLYSRRHLLESEQYEIVNSEVEQSKINGSGKVDGTYTYKEVNLNAYDETDSSYQAQQEIQRRSSSSEPIILPGESSVTIQMKEIDVKHEINSEKPVVSVNSPEEKGSHSSSSSENEEDCVQESQKNHPPRRVSYAGVISVHIPETPKEDGEGLDNNKLYPPRPPTPRFPRGMRVGSNDSSISAQLIDLYPFHNTSKKSISEEQEHPKLVHLEKKNEDKQIEKVQVKEFTLEQLNMNEVPLENKIELVYLSTSGSESEVVKSSGINLTINGEEGRSKQEGTRGTKKVTLSDEFQEMGRRSKLMSLDRNQFLGWNPEKGVLEEADPGSREREQRRWTRSLGAWRTSTSTPWTDEVDRNPEDGVDDEDLDDVFQEGVESIPKSEKHSTHVSQAVIFSEKVITVQSSKNV